MAEVAEIEEVVESRLRSLNYCFQCGACSSVCPFSMTVAFNPRQLILLSRLEPEKVLDSEQIWLCSSCHACVTRCPMEVKPPEQQGSRARQCPRAYLQDALFSFEGDESVWQPLGQAAQ